MFRKILATGSAVAALGLLFAPAASAKDGQVFRSLQECQAQVTADVAVGGGSWNVYGWCTETHVVYPPTFGCNNQQYGCLGDYWVEHTRPV